MNFSLSNIRVYSERHVWRFYFVTPQHVYSVHVRGVDIGKIPHVLRNVAVLFFDRGTILNDGTLGYHIFPLHRGALTVAALSDLLSNVAIFIRISSVHRSLFSEGARGVHLLLGNTGFNMILHQNTDKRIYLSIDSDLSSRLRLAYSRYGAFENVSFSDS